MPSSTARSPTNTTRPTPSWERLAAEQGLTPRPEADKGPGPTDDTNPKESGAGE